MSEQIFFKDVDQLRWEHIKATATQDDRILGSFLMRMAFHNSDREQQVGLGPVYLIQAYNINRGFISELRGLL